MARPLGAGLIATIRGNLTGYGYLLGTVLLTVYGQVVFKWRLEDAGDFPAAASDRLHYLARVAVDPWMVTVAVSVGLAAFTWGGALARFDLSLAYPFMSLSFVLVLLLGALLFNESITAPKLIGIALICAGVIVVGQG